MLCTSVFCLLICLSILQIICAVCCLFTHSFILLHLYCCLIYRLLRWLLGLGNFFLVLLLSICLGGACFGLGWLFSPLYAVHFDPQEFLDRSLIQALYLPVAWLLLTATRPLACSHDEE